MTQTNTPRSPRALETREKEANSYVYVPASQLPDPTPDPDYDFHWVAIRVGGQLNHTRMSQILREGWVPVKAVDHPELQLEANEKGQVELGGLLLCKAPKFMTAAKRAYYDKVAHAQMSAVDNSFMANSDSRMPLSMDKQSVVRRGRGAFGSGNS